MKILLSGGGTAGHITPLLAVAKEISIQSPECELIFVGQKGDKNIEVVHGSKEISSIRTIQAGKFRRFHSLTLIQNILNFKVNLLNARDVLYILIGFFQSLYLLMINRPDAIFFKGGFVVVPLGFAARLLRIPYMTHDSDPLPGLANRLIARGATKNAVVNDQVVAYPSHKTVITGIPLSDEYEQRRGALQSEYKQKLGFPVDSVLLFVYTGTQGARVIDEALDSLLPEIMNQYPYLHVAYVFGRLNEHTIDQRFESLDAGASKRLRKLTFVSDAYDYIAASDVIVARAGATSMAEFATIGRATIVIPAEQLTGGHQLMNAEMYSLANAAVIVREAELPMGLDKALQELLQNSEKRKELENAIRKLAPSLASQRIAETIISIAEGTR